MDQEFDDAQSLIIEKAQNLSPDAFKLLKCEYCERSFFSEKLGIHQKYCNQQHPMTKSPPKRQKKFSIETKTPLKSHHEIECQKCGIKIPQFLYEKHSEKCNRSKPFQQAFNKKEQNLTAKKRFTDVGFKQQKRLQLPQIKTPNPENQSVKRRKVIPKYNINFKVREELSCLRRAIEVQQVECKSCGRKFEKKAALRHIPICEILTEKQQKSIVLKKKQHKKSSTNRKNFKVDQYRSKSSAIE